MAVSDVNICNSALNMIGASNILDLTEDSKTGRICNQRYEFVRDAVMRAHPWNCLIQRTSLAPDATSPVFEFSYQFTLPTDPYCLRLLSLEQLDTIHRVEGRKILTDESTINILYIGRVNDPQQWDTLLVETIAARMAADIAYAIVGSNNLVQDMYNLYSNKLSEARFVDATEGTPGAVTGVADSGSILSDTFINSRY
jgi:hypothetical protein